MINKLSSGQRFGALALQFSRDVRKPNEYSVIVTNATNSSTLYTTVPQPLDAGDVVLITADRKMVTLEKDNKSVEALSKLLLGYPDLRYLVQTIRGLAAQNEDLWMEKASGVLQDESVSLLRNSLKQGEWLRTVIVRNSHQETAQAPPVSGSTTVPETGADAQPPRSRRGKRRQVSDEQPTEMLNEVIPDGKKRVKVLLKRMGLTPDDRLPELPNKETE